MSSWPKPSFDRRQTLARVKSGGKVDFKDKKLQGLVTQKGLARMQERKKDIVPIPGRVLRDPDHETHYQRVPSQASMRLLPQNASVPMTPSGNIDAETGTFVSRAYDGEKPHDLRQRLVRNPYGGQNRHYVTDEEVREIVKDTLAEVAPPIVAQITQAMLTGRPASTRRGIQ